jgi:hypothetical protein
MAARMEMEALLGRVGLFLLRQGFRIEEIPRGMGWWNPTFRRARNVGHPAPAPQFAQDRYVRAALGLVRFNNSLYNLRAWLA